MLEKSQPAQDQCSETSQQFPSGGAASRAQAYIRFIKALHESRSKWSVPAIEFYVSHLMTGIHPDDWHTVLRWDLDGEPGLWVFPFHDSHAPSTYRRKSMLFTGYDAALVNLIDRHIDRVRRCETDEAFQAFYTACKRIIQAVASRSVPAAYKLPSLDNKIMGLSMLHRQAIATAACNLLKDSELCSLPIERSSFANNGCPAPSGT